MRFAIVLGNIAECSRIRIAPAIARIVRHAIYDDEVIIRRIEAAARELNHVAMADPEETARRALKEFLPLRAVDPDRVSGVDEVVADAIAFKFITAPLTAAQRAGDFSQTLTAAGAMNSRAM